MAEVSAEVSIIGPGAVGLALADALSRANVSVEVVAKRERVDDLKQRGLWVKRPSRSVAAINVPVVSEVSPDTRCIVLTPKTYALPQAIERYCASRGPETAVLALQNGLSADGLLQKLAPRVARFGGVVTFTATSLRPGEVEVHQDVGEFLRMAIGSDDPEHSKNLANEPWFLALSKGVRMMPVRSLEGARWTKLIINLNNGLFAATGLAARQFFSHQYGPWLAVQIMREGLAVAKASKVKLHKIPWASPFLMMLLASLPDGPAVALFKNQAEKTLSTELDTFGSMLQSLKRKEPTEVDELNGTLTRFGAPLGVPTPLNDAVVEAVKAQGRGELPVKIDTLLKAALDT